MKRLTYLLIFVASFGYSQNNLVFNKVLNFRLATNQTATVPPDKAWKIEGNPGIQFTSPNPEYGISSGSYSATDDVVWLAEGTTIIGSNAPSLSILEFDVVPVSTTSTSSGGLSSEGLEFNQVINYSNNVAVSGWGEIIDTIVVPDGKVWKLTRVTLTEASSPTSTLEYTPNIVSDAAIYLGGILIFFRSSINYNSSSYESYPIWINSGTKELAVGDSDGNTNRFLVTFTAIEYNIPQ